MSAFAPPSPLFRLPSHPSVHTCRPRMTIAQPRPAHLSFQEPAPTAPAAPPRPGASTQDDAAAKEPPITLIDGVEEYLRMLEQNQDALVVLKIFAPWCRSCRGLQPKVARLSREFSQVRFFKMDFEKNRQLCARLGVTSMPTFVFYWGKAGEIDKFSCGPKRAALLREKIEQCLSGRCEV